MIIGAIITGFVGMVLVVLGYLVWKKEKISLFHDYHYDKVSEENKKAFCTISGVGLILAGGGLLVTAVMLLLTNSVWSFIAFAVGFVVGVGMLMYAGSKYNR